MDVTVAFTMINNYDNFYLLITNVLFVDMCVSSGDHLLPRRHIERDGQGSVHQRAIPHSGPQRQDEVHSPP